MLAEIHIQNYALVESLSLEFHSGLNLLTGETGSGKSILVDALGLALGGRASPEMIRTGKDRASVTAIFRAGGEAPWQTWVEEFGVSAIGEGELILRREIQTEGRSRMLVNDQPMTLAAVKELARRLVDVHGQNEHVVLFAREAQLELLDQAAGVERLLEDIGSTYKRFSHLRRETGVLAQNEQERLRAVDVLRFQVDELNRANLDPGEDVRLEEERCVLGNVEKVKAAAASAFANLYEDEGSALALLAAVEKSVEELARYDASATAQREALTSARRALEDVADFLRDDLERIEADPARLEEVEDRLALIGRLKRKYGLTIDDILQFTERAQSELSELEHADERRSGLERELKAAEAEYAELAKQLSAKRRAAARSMEKMVKEELAQLAMEKTRFEIRFSDDPKAEPGPAGIDQIELLIAANPGEDLRPLEKTASGGELSRLMLALKTVVGRMRDRVTSGAGKNPAQPGTRSGNAASGGNGLTLVFDEVDAGIGGRVAEFVGQRLKALSRQAQVLCVTHLAQIACFADHHYQVEKSEQAGRTVTLVRSLESSKDRAEELARMLSGSHITEAALKHAAAMLKLAAG
ncbi:MAG TPA: DNA repair protein RecN [Terriglobia bacterium]|nr:DNA repair protein RecN [Terriglobia bacterium]